MRSLRTKITSILALVALTVMPACASALTYQLLVNDIPFIKDSVGKGLPAYLQSLYSLGTAIAIILAILLFVYYGVLYMTTDIMDKKGEAKGAFTNIIWGLVLIFSSWIILNTINPALVNFRLFDTLKNNGSKQEPSGPGGTTLPDANSCKTCVPVPDDLPLKDDICTQGSDCVLDQALISKLQALNSSAQGDDIVWHITEVSGKTYSHVSRCHQNGTCIDASIGNKNATTINKFADMARQAGLKPIYEVTSTDRYTELILEGVNPNNITTNPASNGEHFHITNTAAEIIPGT